MSKDILSIIQINMSAFSKGQRLIAGFILESYDKAAFMTANHLGKTVNVNESTVVCFAAELRYDDYLVVQKVLQEVIHSKLTSIQYIGVSNDRIGNQDILSMVVQPNTGKIHMTLEETGREDFDWAVNVAVGTRHIYILGVCLMAALTSFLGLYFNLIFDNVTVAHVTSTGEVFEQLLCIGPNDTIVSVSLPRYPCRTVEATQLARDRGVVTIALTDNETSPLALISTLTLLVKDDMAPFVDSLVVPLSLISALTVAIDRKKNDNLSQTSGILEQIWNEYEVYEKVEEITQSV